MKLKDFEIVKHENDHDTKQHIYHTNKDFDIVIRIESNKIRLCVHGRNYFNYIILEYNEGSIKYKLLMEKIKEFNSQYCRVLEDEIFEKEE